MQDGGEVYTAAEKYGLGFVGGTCGDVGVGGLGLVGGYGWLTGAHGLSVDNIVQLEVVLADGSIVTASGMENPDLYWAMRGAGPCCGVATNITFQGHRIDQVWHGDLVFPSSAFPAIFEFVNYILRISKGESSGLPIFVSYQALRILLLWLQYSTMVHRARHKSSLLRCLISIPL